MADRPIQSPEAQTTTMPLRSNEQGEMSEASCPVVGPSRPPNEVRGTESVAHLEPLQRESGGPSAEGSTSGTPTTASRHPAAQFMYSDDDDDDDEEEEEDEDQSPSRPDDSMDEESDLLYQDESDEQEQDSDESDWEDSGLYPALPSVQSEHEDVAVVYPRRHFKGARNVETVKDG